MAIKGLHNQSGNIMSRLQTIYKLQNIKSSNVFHEMYRGFNFEIDGFAHAASL